MIKAVKNTMMGCYLSLLFFFFLKKKLTKKATKNTNLYPPMPESFKERLAGDFLAHKPLRSVT